VDSPETILCQNCGLDAPIILVRSTDKLGQWAYWPKSIIRDGTLAVFIRCPKCGEREQCIVALRELKAE
jgi:predicted RNA-binding Zn-ribbon protein involved in translation (DUF1610 family)